MKRVLCIAILYTLLYGISIRSVESRSIPVEIVSPGDTLKFKVHNTDAKKLKVHEQNRWRYLRSFKCRQNKKHADCSLSIQGEKHAPTVFSIFEDKSNGDAEIKRYVAIKPQD